MHVQRRLDTEVRLTPDTTRRLKLVALVLGLFALSCSGSGGIGSVGCSIGLGTESNASDALVFRNFTLIDGGDHAPLPKAAMVVEKGRISWVGPEADLKAPSGAKTSAGFYAPTKALLILRCADNFASCATPA